MGRMHLPLGVEARLNRIGDEARHRTSPRSDRTSVGQGAGAPPRVDVLGVEISAINPEMAIDIITRWVEAGAREYVCVRDVHGVVKSLDDPELRRIHRASGLVTPDGMPLVWAGRLAGARWMRRVYGPNLMLDICSRSVEQGWSHFFYGAGPGVADDLASRLKSRFPGLEVVGTHSPPYADMTPKEISETSTMLNQSGADFIWVGLSTPKQELWMDVFRPMLNASAILGVGAAFDIHAGRVPQAPTWIQRSGLEWAFRLAVEPRRLWRRYLSSIPRFLWRILLKRPRLIEVSPPTDATYPSTVVIDIRDQATDTNLQGGQNGQLDPTIRGER